MDADKFCWHVWVDDFDAGSGCRAAVGAVVRHPLRSVCVKLARIEVDWCYL